MSREVELYVTYSPTANQHATIIQTRPITSDGRAAHQVPDASYTWRPAAVASTTGLVAKVACGDVVGAVWETIGVARLRSALGVADLVCDGGASWLVHCHASTEKDRRQLIRHPFAARRMTIPVYIAAGPSGQSASRAPFRMSSSSTPGLPWPP